ncbi:MAG TPA: cation transporter [Savagea sp.]
MSYVQFDVEGMSCHNCVNAIDTALLKIEGVHSVQVDLEKGTVTVDYDGSKTDESALSLAIELQGFDVIE